MSNALTESPWADWIAASPDPALAQLALERWVDVVYDGPERFLAEAPADLPPALVRLLASSPFFGDVLSQQASVLDHAVASLAHDGPEKGEEQLARELDAALFEAVARSTRDRPSLDKATRRRGLCFFKRRELFRMGLLDIAGRADIGAQCRQLSALARLGVRLALDDLLPGMVAQYGVPMVGGVGKYEPSLLANQCGFAVIAMGKLGGGELNFSSDLDLIFVYEREGWTTGVPQADGAPPRGVVTHNDFYSKLATAIADFVGGMTRDGLLWRVDLRLRPGGPAGAMARSLAGYESYFADEASPWEQIAYLKARAIAGDPRVARLFEEMAQGFVFAGIEPHVLLPEVARLKSRIDDEGLDDEGRAADIKRGPGGIREIEFLVAARQILGGGTDHSLRVGATIPALERLTALGQVPREMATRLTNLYWFYRRVEHILQMREEQQTQSLPRAEGERRALAAWLGYDDPGIFDAELAEGRTFVRREFDAFFTAERRGEMSLVDCLEGGQQPSPSQRVALAAVGLDNAEGLAALRALAIGTREMTIRAAGRRMFEGLLPSLIEELNTVAMPAAAVGQLSNFMRAHKSVTSLYDLMQAHPPVLRLLLRLLGYGSLPARHLVADPNRLDEMLEGNGLAANRLPSIIYATEHATAIDAAPSEEALRLLRRFRDREAFFLAAREILGVLPADDAAAQTTDLAEIVLRATAAIIARDSPPPARWCVLAFGSFGGMQTHICADLDVAFFIESPEGQPRSDRERTEAFCTRLLSTVSAITPHGQLWRMDARLRPEGVNGPLVCTLERTYEYYLRDAGIWEFQSATRARYAAGDRDLAKSALKAMRDAFSARPPLGNVAGAILDMRRRMEAAVKLPRHAAVDLKRSPGGLIDLEFLVQYFQLTHGLAQPRILAPVTREALKRLAEAGLLDTALVDDLENLRRDLRTIQRAIRLLGETGKDYLPADEERRRVLARGLNAQLADPRAALDGLPAGMTALRREFDRLLRAATADLDA